MKESLRDIVRRVISGSILVTGTSTPAVATVAVDHPSMEIPPPAPEARMLEDPGVMVLRERRPRLILTRASESSLALLSSHRSHRSHSSHRSHYSSSGGGSVPRSPTPRRRSAPPPPPPVAAYCIPTTAEMGSRLLQRGMCGSDVAELMRLLVVHGHLASYNMNADSLFTIQVENAVKSFQRSRDLTPDGKVGPITLRHLQGEP